MTFWDGLMLGSLVFWMGEQALLLHLRSLVGSHAVWRRLALLATPADFLLVGVTLAWLLYSGRFAP